MTDAYWKERLRFREKEFNMMSNIDKIITEYNEIVNERDSFKLKCGILQQALHIVNLMFINGEKHSDSSKKKIKRLTDSSFLIVAKNKVQEEDVQKMEEEEKEMTFPMLSQNNIMDAHPEHYGKWVIIKGFNDNSIVAYGDTWQEAQADAKSKGYKIVGHVDDPEPPNIMMYCKCPCESQIGISTIVSGPMFEACETKPICPVCKHRKKE